MNTVIGDAQQQADKCAVCGDVSNTYSFGVFCCRACLAFFRRSQGRSYTCRRDGNCDITQDGLRTSCRACRLRKCHEVGMSANAEGESSPANIASTLTQSLILSPRTTSTGSSTPSTDGSASVPLHHSSYATQIPASTQQNFMSQPQPVSVIYVNSESQAASTEYSLLHIMDFQNVRHAQKSMHAMENPDSVFAEAKYKPVTKAEYKRMETGTLSLVFSMLSDTLNHFDVQDQAQKVEVLKTFVPKYTTSFGSFLSVQVFPDPSDNRIVTHYGGYISPETTRIFFEGYDRVEEKEKYVRCGMILGPVLATARKCISKMCRLQVREIEVAALVGIMLWEQLERMDLITPLGEQIRERMYTDFHNDVIAHYGPSRGAARVVKILCLIEDIGDLIASYKEMELIAKIFGDGTCTEDFVTREQLTSGLGGLNQGTQ